jgi:ClpP class serine protease
MGFLMPNGDLFSQVMQEYKPDPNTLVKKRQEILKELGNKLNAPVVAYIANTMHPISAMMQPDVDAVMDFVKVASRNSKKVYLILESSGGDGNVAEKLLHVFREVFTESFNVIVPNLAKSAATMLSIGADKIIMGTNSELGPIDPQIAVMLPTGQSQYVPAKSITGTLTKIKEEIEKNEKLATMYYPILQQIRPETIKYCEDAIAFSTSFAKRWLKEGSMRGKSENDIEKTAKELTTGARFNMHGSVINHQDAQASLGLNVEFWDQTDERWQLLWDYYLRSRASFQMNPNAAKLFETTETSVTMNVQVIMQGLQPVK